jgi:predicted nucleotidyltransferase
MTEIQEIADAIVRSVNLEKVFLLGSEARGDARPDSDLDLLIVAQAPYDPHRSRLEELRKIRAV